jgi:hypothetical protein
MIKSCILEWQYIYDISYLLGKYGTLSRIWITQGFEEGEVWFHQQNHSAVDLVGKEIIFR